jgi:hypothetical protein
MFDSKTVWDGDTAEFEQDGFTIKVRIVYDETPDTSFIGEFSATPEEGAIDHFATDNWLERSYRGERYFNPANYALSYYRDEEKLPLDEAKAKADEQAQEDYERMIDYAHGGWTMVGVIVKVFREGIELGSDSIWGTESDAGGEYFEELVREQLVPEALHMATENLNKLVASTKETA